MGRNSLHSAILIALLGATSTLQAQTETTPAPVAAPAATTVPAAESAPAAQAAPAPAAAPAADAHKQDAVDAPKPAAKPAKKAASKPAEKVKTEGVPERGSSMAEVEKRFGKPKKKLAPVGNPPITRWVYRDYTVYFEHEYVIHSVKDEDVAPVSGNTPAMSKPAAKPAAKSEKPATAPAPHSAPAAAAPAPATPAETPAPAATQEPAAATPAAAH